MVTKREISTNHANAVEKTGLSFKLLKLFLRNLLLANFLVLKEILRCYLKFRLRNFKCRFFERSFTLNTD